MENQPKILKSFCTTREAAEMLGVSLRTAQMWTEAGLLEAWKTEGGHRRISRQSVERLLASGPGPRAMAPVPDNKLVILVVDDEAEILRLYERQMSRWPMHPEIITAKNGIEALVKLGLVMPDLLVTDLRMPDMDGFQMLQQLKAMPELADMTTVVVSGLDQAAIEAGGVPAGIPVLPKPIPFDRLLDIATVVADLKRKRAEAEVRA